MRHNGHAMYWDYIVILVTLAVIVPWRSQTQIKMLLDADGLSAHERISLYLSTIGFQWLACLIIGWRLLAHRTSLENVGLMAPDMPRGVVAAIVLSILLAFNQILGVRRLANLPIEKRGLVGKIAEKLLPRSRKEEYAAVALISTVAICEEFIYRGFIEYLFQDWMFSLLAGAVISAVLFALAHSYQGRRGIVTTFVVGLILSGVRIWTGSLIPSIIVHFAVDFTAGFASLRMLKTPCLGEA
jgi:uncharacterized protein